MFLVEEDRYIYSANVVCANQNIKKSGYSSLKQNPFVQKRKTNLLESHCRTKTPRRNKIARTTRKAGRCDEISCNRYARRALSGVSLWKKALPGVEKTTLFLLQLGDDGNPKKMQTSRFGDIFSNRGRRKNIEQVEGSLYRNLGKEKTTPQTKRDILAVLYSDLHA